MTYQPELGNICFWKLFIIFNFDGSNDEVITVYLLSN